MTTSVNRSFLPKKFQILSGSTLKIIAMLIMLIDHSGYALLNNYPPAKEILFTFNEKSYTMYQISRDIGRMAFPIFAFLLVEGFIHTRNRLKYGCSLFLFACISELPWNYEHTGTLYYDIQNVYFTLFLGYLAFCAIEYFWENQTMQLICLLALFAVAYYLKADYGWKGYIFLLIMYWFRNEGASQAIIGSCWLHYEWKACFAFPLINMYNGERGFIKGKASKYIFYAFYPVHIAILGILKYKFFVA